MHQEKTLFGILQKTVTAPAPWSTPSRAPNNLQASPLASKDVQAGNQLRRRLVADNPPSQQMEMSMLQQVVPHQQRPRLPPKMRRIPRKLPHRPPGRAGVARHAGYFQCAPSRLVVLISSI
ncbi:hypothetical protein ACFX2F_033623 [Malus domestica]